MYQPVRSAELSSHFPSGMPLLIKSHTVNCKRKCCYRIVIQKVLISIQQLLGSVQGLVFSLITVDRKLDTSISSLERPLVVFLMLTYIYTHIYLLNFFFVIQYERNSAVLETIKYDHLLNFQN